MNIYSIFVALLANSALARYNNPYANPRSNLGSVRDSQAVNGRYPPAALSSNPTNHETGHRGNMNQYPNPNTPPYWHEESDDTSPWYNNEPGTQKANKPPNTPPYWDEESDGTSPWYNNEPKTQKANKPPYAISKPSYLGSDDPQPGDKCYHGNQRNVAPATQAPYPPCWYKQSDGAWACFSYVNGKCPWDGAVGPQTSSYLSPSTLLNNEDSQQGATCYEGNMKDKPNDGPNYPPCWYKQEDETYACFDKYKGECPWEGALPPQTQSLLSSTTAPEYTESPGILGAIRSFLLTFQL
jgi:hypothetical protein